ncbi:MAG: tetratricopeptide repeat protein [Planctomycetaceae bacterium]
MKRKRLPNSQSSPRRLPETVIAALLFVAILPGVIVGDDDVVAQKTHQRYVQLLKRQPRKGTAFDRVYDFLVQHRQVDQFLTELQGSESAQPDDGSSAMVRGMLLQRNQQPTEAVVEFRQASSARPQDAFPEWYLAEVLLETGQPAAAAEAFEEALRRDPPTADRLKIYQQLGRLYLQTADREVQMDLWQRCERDFPDDIAVRRQIADILVENGELQTAVQRYEALAAAATDPYERTELVMKTAELQTRLGQFADAIRKLEQLQQTVRPDSWQFAKIRDQVEQAWLAGPENGDLTKYYRQRLEKSPDDTDAIRRLSRLLAADQKFSDAAKWLQTAVQKHPSDTSLREALVQVLQNGGMFAEAISEYQQLLKLNPANDSYRENLGLAFLRNEKLTIEQRHAEARQIWMGIASAQPPQAASLLAAATLFQSAAMNQDAEQLLVRATREFPGDLQVHEQLGEFLLRQGRSSEAVAAWAAIAAGDFRTVDRLLRLADVLRSHDLRADAVQVLQDVCRMEADSSHHRKLAEVLLETSQPDEALRQLDRALQLATSSAERRAVREQQLAALQTSGRLTSQIAERQRSALQSPEDADQWIALAELQEAAGLLKDAAMSVTRAIDLKSDDVDAWATASRIQQKAGLLAQAAASLETLATIDPRRKTQHLRRQAELQQQLGRTDAAVQTAEAMINAATGSPDGYRFLAELLQQQGRDRDATDVLRRAVQISPGDVESLKALARLLAEQFQTEDAISVYWQAFRKSDDSEQQVVLIQDLAGLYQRLQQSDRLVQEVRQMVQSGGGDRNQRQLLAKTLQLTGDQAGCRQILEDLHLQLPKDVELLKELVIVTERLQDFPAAIRFQQQLSDLSPRDANPGRLAEMLKKNGQTDAVQNLWIQAANSNSSPEIVGNAIDQLLLSGKAEAAAEPAVRLLQRDPTSPSVLLKLAVIHLQVGQSDVAADFCDRLIRQEISAEEGVVEPQQLPGAGFRTLLFLKLIPRIPQDLSPTTTTAPWQTENNLQARCAAVMLQTHLQLQAAGQSPAEFLQEVLKRPVAAGNSSTGIVDQFAAVQAIAPLVEATDLQQAQRNLVAAIEPEHPVSPQDAMLMVWLIHQANKESKGAAAESPDLLRKYAAAWHVVLKTNPDWLNKTEDVATLLRHLNSAEMSDVVSDLKQSLVIPDAGLPELEAALLIAGYENRIADVTVIAERIAGSPSSQLRSPSDILRNIGWLWSRLASVAMADNDPAGVQNLLNSIVRVRQRLSESIEHARSGRNEDVADFEVVASQRTYRNGQQSNSVRISTLPPDRFWSSVDINFFVNISLLADRPQLQKLTRSLQSDMEQNSAASTSGSPDASTERLKTAIGESALAHLNLLSGDRDAAAGHLIRVAELVPHDAWLRLRLATFYQQHNHLPEALALLDTIGATDAQILQIKELTALDLAGQSGRPDRARTAAERLAGLRLPSDVAIKVAAAMQTLDMNDDADVLLNRTRKSVGSELNSLLQLMTEFERSGQQAISFQIAHQILQQTETGSRRSAQADAARSDALKLLATGKQLPPMIDRLQHQLQADPDSVVLLRQLAELLNAVGDQVRAAEVGAKLAKLQPTSIDSNLKLAQQYESIRNFDRACDSYLLVLQQDPQRFTQNYYQYLRTFSSAGRLPDLADVLLAGDLRRLHNNYYVVSETIEDLFQAARSGDDDQSRRHRDKALELLAAAWKAFPNDHGYLLNNLRDPMVWSLPVMFQYAREGLLPSSRQQAAARPWHGVADAVSVSADGRISGTLGRLLKAIPDNQQLAALTADVRSAMEDFPGWHGGQLVLAVLEARSGNIRQANDLLAGLNRRSDSVHVPVNSAWLAGAELEAMNAEFTPAAADMLSAALEHEPWSSDQGFSASPGRRLAVLRKRQEQPAAAREAVLTTLQAQRQLTSAEPGLQAFRLLQDLKSAADELAELHFSLDAIGLLQQMTPELFAESQPYKAAASAGQLLQSAARRQQELASAVTVGELLTHLNRVDTGAPDLLLKAPAEGQTVDWSSSAVVQIVRRLAADRVVRRELEGALSMQLQTSRSQSAAIVMFAFAQAVQNENLQEEALTVLADRERSDDDHPATGAAEWLVARILLKDQRHSDHARLLAEHAEAASERWAADDAEGRRWLAALLRERGELAVAAGDLKTASAAWTHLLDTILPPTPAADAAVQDAGSSLQELRKRLLSSPEPSDR